MSELLGVDEEYRHKAAADRLPRIAPHRFNPTHQAWLPILHAARGGRHYTALYSNTARAHRLGTTHDWVVIYRDDHGGHGQWTVITARLGPMRGKRIVRGREEECAGHHRCAAHYRCAGHHRYAGEPAKRDPETPSAIKTTPASGDF